jgi:hypothetical protein
MRTRALARAVVVLVGGGLVVGAVAGLLLTPVLAAGVLLGFGLLLLADRLFQPTPVGPVKPRIETTYDGVRVVGVDRLRGGQLALSLAWDTRHRIELDRAGVPVGVTAQGPGRCVLTLSARQFGGVDPVRALRDLVGCDLSFVEQEQVGRTRRVLAGPHGVVLDLRA